MSEQTSRGARWARALFELILIGGLYLGIRAYTQRHLVQGEAPELSGLNLTGEAVSLAQSQGTPIIVHFFATWCRVCRMEEGSVASLAKDHPLIAVGTGSGDAKALKAYLEAQGISLPVLVDEDGALSRAWGVEALPTTFFVDGEGKIRFVETGYTTEIGLRLRRWWTARM